MGGGNNRPEMIDLGYDDLVEGRSQFNERPVQLAVPATVYPLFGATY